ncbi:hypothetical protein [Candidatus Arsenophonus triatominarum]|uniref:hypothetical protein n=1 Tax=Candidatus Arsenophonus triatominarum TaxID=57911 RepID=UPI00165084BE|nr:hypothetical protein [Candidatus Arsenophonus triatominarum]
MEFFNQLAAIYAVEKQADGNFTFAMGSFIKKSHITHIARRLNFDYKVCYELYN